LFNGRQVPARASNGTAIIVAKLSNLDDSALFFFIGKRVFRIYYRKKNMRFREN